MNDSFLMRCRQSVYDLQRIVDCFSLRQRTAARSLSQCLAFEQLRDDVRRPVMRAYVEDGKNIRMIQRAGSTSLLLETMQTLRIIRITRRQHLDRDVAAQLRIAGKIHLAHSAFTNLGADFVTTEF